MASRRELLDSLKPGMHLDKNFFLKVYGYEITRPGFAEDVIKRLEILGCSKAREYYTCIVTDLPNAVTVCAGQLVRIADALEELNEMLDGIIDKTDGHLCIKGMIENV